MLKVAGMTAGATDPSSRFRIRQYAAPLAERQIALREHCPFVNQRLPLPGHFNALPRRYLPPWAVVQMGLNIAARTPGFLGARRADLVWISRSVLPGLERAVDLLPRPRVLDVDDAIWLAGHRGERTAARLARQVDAVVAGNETIAAWYRPHAKRVTVVPTPVDTALYRPAAALAGPAAEAQTLTIGWIGTDGNHPNLAIAKPAVKALLADRPETRFLVVSNRRPAGWAFDDRRLIFRPWAESRELADLQAMDIGLMPLQDTPWSRGKCSYKLLQYLAVGIPAVASPVGMNRDVLTSGDVGMAADSAGDWYAALDRLCADAALRRHMGRKGRHLVEQAYSTERCADRLATLFHDLADG